MASSECEGSVLVPAECEDAARRSIKEPSGCEDAEYPCVKRLRHRRLLSFLHAQGFHGIAHVVAGNENKYLHQKYISQVDLRLCDITLSILASSPDQFRASMDWEKVRKKAAFLVYSLALVTPELRCSLYLPTASIMPHDVLPLASSSRHRRHLKRPPPPRKTKSIFRALKRQQYIMDYVFKSKIETLDGAKEKLSDMIDESLMGCLREGYCLSPLPQSGKEGSHAMFGAFTIPAKNSGILSVNDSGPPSSQTMLGSLTDQAKTSGISSLTNAVPLNEVSAGTGKHSSEAGCYTECACQDFNGRKDPRDELTTVEEGRDPKRKRTTGVFGEASLISVTEVGAIARMPAGAIVNFSGVSSG